MADLIDIDYDNMSNDEVERLLRSAGYDPKLVGKYYALVAENTILRQERDLLREAVEAVEWIPVATTSVCICPWCGYPSYNDHAPDCLRQRALGKAEVKP